MDLKKADISTGDKETAEEILEKWDGKHIIDVESVSFGYSSEQSVLQDINIQIDEPGFVCVIGPNGVGKSTLIRLINGLMKPSSGTVRIFGKPVEEFNLKEMAKLVGYVPVMTYDFNVMTVLDTVMIGRYAHQKWKTNPEDITISHKALEAMEIDHLAMRQFNELSAGQHQKVSISRGLVQEPRILILDEPTSNLDIRHQMYVSMFLKSLCQKTGMTVLMISHDLNLAAKFADKVIVMETPGKVYGMGTPQEMMTEEMISQVYNVKCDIIDDHGTPHVMLQDISF